MLAVTDKTRRDTGERMPRVVIRDEHVDYEIDGRVIAGGPDHPVSTALDSRQRQRARWMEATLYAKDDGTYVLHQVNYSLVWHLAGSEGHVRKPAETLWSRLPRAAVYCGFLPPREQREQCPPAGRRGPKGAGRVVLTELPQHKVSSHPDYASVIKAVTVARRGDGSSSAAVSEPMRELLRQAAENDAAFAAGIRPVIRM
jgi:hypothetical protein